MKVAKLSKKLWTDTILEELDFATPSCTVPLLLGCGGCGCGCGCCCPYMCKVLIC